MRVCIYIYIYIYMYGEAIDLGAAGDADYACAASERRKASKRASGDAGERNESGDRDLTRV